MQSVKHDIHPEALDAMRARGGQWAAYCNMALDSALCGHMKFLRHGEGCTFSAPPKPRLPDNEGEINWRYLYVGEVNLETGEVEPKGTG